MAVQMTQEQAVGETRQMLQSRGWLLVKTRIETERENLEKAFFANRAEAEKKGITADYIAGYRHLRDILIEGFPAAVREFDVNKAAEQAALNGTEPVGGPYVDLDNPGPKKG